MNEQDYLIQAIICIRSHPRILDEDKLLFESFVKDIYYHDVDDETIREVNKQIKKYKNVLYNYGYLGDLHIPNWDFLKNPAQAGRILSNMAVGFKYFERYDKEVLL